MDLRKIGLEIVGCMQFTQDSVRWWVSVTMVVSVLDPRKQRIC
jgi:hypothetical protein